MQSSPLTNVAMFYLYSSTCIKIAFENIVQWYCTLHILAADGLRMPRNGCSKGGELLATGQPSSGSTNNHHTHQTYIQTSKLCLPLYSFVHQTKGLLFYRSQSVLGPLWRKVPRHPPQSLSNTLQHNSALFCKGVLHIFILQLKNSKHRLFLFAQTKFYNP